jgi:thioredoxin-related protein
MKHWVMGLAAAVLAFPLWAAEVDGDGLHVEPWIRDTFKDLQEDLAEARAEGKRLAIFVEQKGCIYCSKMHTEVYSNETIADYIEENFFVVRLNLHGATEATDTDGEAMAERDLARKWGILFTPTVVFLPEEVPEDTPAIRAAVAVMPGAFGKQTTLDMYTWVKEERYAIENGEDFQRYHARRIAERQAAGGN